MKIDYSPRGSGKTTKIVEWVRADIENRYLITYSTREEQRLKDTYPDIAHRIWYWETYANHSVNTRYNNAKALLGVDNADHILERAIGGYIARASVTKEVIAMRDPVPMAVIDPKPCRKKKEKIKRGICKHPGCGRKFSYRPRLPGLTRHTCDEHRPQYYAQ